MQQRPVLGLKVDQEFADLLDKMLALTAFHMDGRIHYNTRSDFIRAALRAHFRTVLNELRQSPQLKNIVDQEMEKSEGWEKWME